MTTQDNTGIKTRGLGSTRERGICYHGWSEPN
jgi:hypothetical protein